MSSIKLFQVFNSLSESEIKQFTKFVKSGFLSENRDFTKLIHVLTGMKKNGLLTGQDKASLKFIGDSLGIQRSSILTKLSQLYSLLEIYLSVKFLTQDKIRFNGTLQDYFIAERMHKPFEYTYKETEKELKRLPLSFHTIKNYSEHYLRGMQKSFYSMDYKKYHELHKLSTDFMILDFMINFLQMANDTAQQRLNGIEATNLSDLFIDKIDFEKIIGNFIKLNSGIYNLAMAVYYLYKCYSDTDYKQNFLKARHHHLKIAGVSDLLLNTYLYTVQINICIININNGDNEYGRYMFDLIKEKLKNGIYDELRGNNTPVNHFRDYVMVALNLGETNWARSFVNKYSHFLPKDSREDETNLSTGIILLEQKRREEALEVLEKVKKNNFIYYIDLSVTKMRCYYEIENYVEAGEEIARLKSYLDYHKEIPGVHSNNAREIIKDIQMLINYSTGSISKHDAEFYFNKRGRLKKWIREEMKMSKNIIK